MRGRSLLDFIKRKGWVLQYLVALAVTIVVLAIVNAILLIPAEQQCKEAGGHRATLVRGYLCVDAGGHVLIFDR